jgi:S1-C subfamily serine protease
MLQYLSSAKLIMKIIPIITLSFGAILASNVGLAQQNYVQVSSGTGFFVSRTGHVVTNAHVVANCKNKKDIQLRNYNARVSPAELIAIDEKMDLALLSTGVRPNRIATIRWMHTEIQKDEDVFLIGYPEAKSVDSDYVVKTASIKALKGPFGENRWLQFTDAARQGNSGGPLLDYSGNVVGVVTAKTKIMRLNQLSNKQEVIEESDIAVTSNELKKFLDKYYIHYNMSDTGYALTDQALETTARSYVVHIFCEVE